MTDEHSDQSWSKYSELVLQGINWLRAESTVQRDQLTKMSIEVGALLRSQVDVSIIMELKGQAASNSSRIELLEEKCRVTKSAVQEVRSWILKGAGAIVFAVITAVMALLFAKRG